jgi:hypothetical protein
MHEGWARAGATFDFQQYDPAGMGLDSVHLLTNVAKSDLRNTTIHRDGLGDRYGRDLFYTPITGCANTGVDA